MKMRDLIREKAEKVVKGFKEGLNRYNYKGFTIRKPKKSELNYNLYAYIVEKDGEEEFLVDSLIEAIENILTY